MQERLNQLKALLYEIYDLNAAEAVLGWDQQVNMPSGGAKSRGHQLATLATIIHEKRTSDELGVLLGSLACYADQVDTPEDDACLIHSTKREYEKQQRISPHWVAEFAATTAAANSAWLRARQDADFSLFQHCLIRLIDLAREYSSFFAPFEHVYDPLLDEFEPGMKTSTVQAIFAALRLVQVEFIAAIRERPPIADDFLYQDFPVDQQREFCIQAVERLGYDWQFGRMDVSAHPFTTSFGAGDVRFTTRFSSKNIASALFSSFHECGHALYDLGFAPNIQRTSLGQGASAAFHESQSRMMENLVGRSYPFWKFFYPVLQAKFPVQLTNVGLDSFYRAINRVKPSLIRVEADEATYNLHIMLRMEIEIDLLEGTLEVKDLPDAWNQRMQEYLGLVPPDDARGVLQDIHWSMGLIGYFPTYALGNLIAAQLWEKVQADLPSLDHQMERGEFAPLLDWLRMNIHQHGRKYQPQALIKKVTGSTMDPQPYMRYLRMKFGSIYRIPQG